jgi:hypothetical protein
MVDEGTNKILKTGYRRSASPLRVAHTAGIQPRLELLHWALSPTSGDTSFPIRCEL